LKKALNGKSKALAVYAAKFCVNPRAFGCGAMMQNFGSSWMSGYGA
jgi:hypothetical protein